MTSARNAYVPDWSATTPQPQLRERPPSPHLVQQVLTTAPDADNPSRGVNFLLVLKRLELDDPVDEELELDRDERLLLRERLRELALDRELIDRLRFEDFGRSSFESFNAVVLPLSYIKI